ncbi:MAG TPA: DUF3667 domain-containing protein [Flavobacteriales bacterium]|jgi:hypothetical protein|nr:DUF3667 domain-containing protein [Flavobacteriales bacterium]
MPRRRRKSSLQCPNCGTDLRTGDHFCPHCGQENHDLRVPFRHFAYEFVESFTHFDTKAWSTLKMIFTKPGQLTKDFVEGKRARYVKPAQFYVFVSVIFYALLSYTVDHSIDHSAFTFGKDDGPNASFHSILPDSTLDRLGIDTAVRHLQIPITAPFYRREVERLALAPDSVLAKELKELRVPSDSATRAQLRLAVNALPDVDHIIRPYTALVNGRMMEFKDAAEERDLRARLENFSDAQIDSLLTALNGSPPSWTERKAFRSLGNTDMKTRSGRKQVVHAVMKATSIAMFVLMPFTAVLLLWIFYNKRYYWEHLIFSIHIHTIYFLFFTLLLFIGILLPHGFPDGVYAAACVVCLLYLILSLRRVYGKSWGSTFLRLVVMGIPYFIALFLLLTVGTIWGFFAL